MSSAGDEHHRVAEACLDAVARAPVRRPCVPQVVLGLAVRVAEHQGVDGIRVAVRPAPPCGPSRHPTHSRFPRRASRRSTSTACARRSRRGAGRCRPSRRCRRVAGSRFPASPTGRRSSLRGGRGHAEEDRGDDGADQVRAHVCSSGQWRKCRIAGEHHRDAALVGRRDHLVVAHAAAGLDDGNRSVVGDDVEAVAERKEGVRRDDRAGEESPALVALVAAMRVESTRLIWPGADAERAPVAAIDDRVDLDVLRDAPGEHEVARTARRRRLRVTTLSSDGATLRGVGALHEQAAADALAVELRRRAAPAAGRPRARARSPSARSPRAHPACSRARSALRGTAPTRLRASPRRPAG